MKKRLNWCMFVNRCLTRKATIKSNINIYDQERTSEAREPYRNWWIVTHRHISWPPACLPCLVCAIYCEDDKEIGGRLNCWFNGEKKQRRNLFLSGIRAATYFTESVKYRVVFWKDWNSQKDLLDIAYLLLSILWKHESSDFSCKPIILQIFGGLKWQGFHKIPRHTKSNFFIYRPLL